MLAALIIGASWTLCLLVTTALCAAARRGDTQVAAVREAAFVPPVASPPGVAPEVSVARPELSAVRVGGDPEIDRRPQAAADLALQSG